MNRATISADIVSSTSLRKDQRLKFEEKLNELLVILNEKFSKELFFCRIIKGDYVECVLEEPKSALRTSLLIKSYIKRSMNFTQKKQSPDFLKLKKYGIRIAVGVGELNIFDRSIGIISGDAITLSGRAINEISKTKQTLVFRSKKKKWNDDFSVIFNFLDVLFNGYTKAQSEVIFYLLLEKKEKEIVKTLNKSQSTINQHINSANWYAVESAVKYFEKTIK
jgi:hypothetical protein